MPKSTQQLEEKIRLARVINWQRSLDGFTEESLKPLQRAIDQVSNEIMSRLEHWAEHPGTAMEENRMLAVLNELDSMTGGIQAYLTGHIADMAGHAGSTSLDTWGNVLSWDGKVAAFNSVALTASQVRELAIETPVGGRLLADWVSRTFDENMVEGIRREIMAGMLKGEGYPVLVNRIAQGWDMTRTDAVTLARTYVQSANVGAMQSVYKANQDIVKGWRWCATLEIGGKKGGGTCMQCAALDGTEYSMGEANVPQIPLHPRCRCVALPVTKTWRELGLNVDEMEQVYRPWTTSENIIDVGRAAHPPEMMGFHQGSFADLFPKLPESDQLAMIGPGRLGLIQEGKITFSDLVDREMGRLRLLEGKPGAWTGLKGFGGPEGVGGLGMGGFGEGGVGLSEFRNEIQALSKGESEVLQVYDQSGKLLASSYGTDETVDIPSSLKKLITDKDQSLIIHHTHPWENSLSIPDYKKLVEDKGVSELWAHSPESSYRAIVVGDRSKISEVVREFQGQYLVKDYQMTLLDMGIDKKAIRQETEFVETHVLGRVLQDKGLIKYEEFLSDEAKAILQKHSSLVRQLEEKWGLKPESL